MTVRGFSIFAALPRIVRSSPIFPSLVLLSIDPRHTGTDDRKFAKWVKTDSQGRGVDDFEEVRRRIADGDVGKRCSRSEK